MQCILANQGPGGVIRTLAHASQPLTEDLLLLATAKKVKSVKRRSTITELVVVWSLCNVCTSVTKSKVVTLKRFTLFAIVIARSRKISVS